VIELEADVPLAAWCTLEVGGPARWFVRAGTEDQILDALAWADAQRLPVLILGGGSNVVIADDGFPGVVVQIAVTGIELQHDTTTVLFTVGAGEPWDPLVARTVEEDCAGLECLSGIPGLVGGTPVQNVGAYGQEVSSTIQAVRAIDRRTRQVRTFTPGECAFGYRTSRFRHADAGRFIVTQVRFALAPGGAPTVAYADVIGYFAERGTEKPSLRDVRDAVLDIRSRKGMVIRDDNPARRSCGSFFVNPVIPRALFERLGDAPHYPVDAAHVKVPAAWLIEQAGFARGYTQGRVGISPFQAQGLINRGGATAAAVIDLARAIKRAVWERFHIALVPEPVLVGFHDDPAVAWLLDPAPRD
jgi:UDP-N-acetylmuramate dehydrogenase